MLVRVIQKTLKMVLTASLCNALHMNEFELGIYAIIKINICLFINASAYAVGLRLTMLQNYLYLYWTVAETQKEREIGSSTMYCTLYSVQYTCVLCRPNY